MPFFFDYRLYPHPLISHCTVFSVLYGYDVGNKVAPGLDTRLLENLRCS